MADQSVRGRFIWHELATRDGSGARSFYAQALGWTHVASDHNADYSMFAAQRGLLAGVGSLEGAPHWVPFVGVPNVDETVRQAAGRGAQIDKGPTDIAGGGRYAVLRDLQGAVFGIYAPPGEAPPEHAPEPGEFVWHELAAHDWRLAFDFYSELFGWERLDEHDMGPMGTYLLFGRNGVQLGGMFDKRDQGLPGDAYWLGYVSVENVREAAAKVAAAGGRVAAGPMQVPGGGWIAQCTDPAGALFAVHMAPAEMQSGGEAKPAPAADEAAGQLDRGAEPKPEPEPEPKPEPESEPKPESEPERAAAAAAGKRSGMRPPAEKKTPAAAKKKASKKKASKKNTSRKKTSKKKVSKKKVGKKVGKKTRSAKKRPAAKVAKKKAAKKAAKKKVAKKKVGKKKAAGKKAAKKKAAKKKAGKKKGGKKKLSRKASAKKKSTKASKKTGAKKTARRTAKKSPARSGSKRAARKKARAKKPAGTKTVRNRKPGRRKTSRRRAR